MNRETVQARKRFARELAERDRLAAAGECWVPPELEAAVSAEDLLAARMRRWWLARYTLAELAELGAGLVEVRRG